ncbi:unnamed protein product [Sphenostylis stenocarpa]|uniref:Uncharacterized protein n=1 Tax=Sphenostylis stenocarpa TaxID=92480 RepID=A0AA86S9G1_9FABA|nr:unnamed protein product [Sphenostylis stenocarpa]
MKPNHPSTSCNRHQEEQFTGFCPACLHERLTILGYNSFSSFQPLPSLPPPLLQLQQPMQMQPHYPSTSCARHPEDQFIGFCSSCLCERLAVLGHNSSSSIHKGPTFSTTTIAPNAIFQPSSSTFNPNLRRAKSYPPSRNEEPSCALESQWKSCDTIDPSTLFNQDEKHKIPMKEPNVETCNLASSSIIQEDEEDNIVNVVNVNELPKAQITKIETDVDAEEILEAMKDQMDVDSQAKEGSNRNLKGCFCFSTSIFKKKLQK